MIVEYIRYTIEPARTSEFRTAYEVASKPKRLPALLGLRAHPMRRSPRKLQSSHPLGLGRWPPEGLPDESAARATVFEPDRGDASLRAHGFALVAMNALVSATSHACTVPNVRGDTPRPEVD